MLIALTETGKMEAPNRLVEYSNIGKNRMGEFNVIRLVEKLRVPRIFESR